MKNIFTSFILFFIAFNSFAQVSVNQLMSAKNGADIFEKMLASTLPNIAAEKQADFKQKAETLATNKKTEATKYFEKKYSQKEIDLIYAELSQEDRLSYSEITSNFIKEWRSYKTQYQSEFKLLYNSFQM